MKSHTQNYLFLFLIIGVLAFLLFQKPQTVKVKVPAIVGSISPAPISYLEPKGEPLVIEWITKTDTIYIEAQGAVNDSLVNVYKDSLTTVKKQFEMYVDAVTYRDFESQFEDPFLKLKVKGTVQGYLKNIEVSHYEIKEQEVKVPQPKMITFGLQAGYGFTVYGETPYVGVGVNMDFEQAIRKLIKGF